MKRLAALLAFLVAGVAAAQEGTYADSKNNFSVSKDGGLVVPVGYLTIKDETTALAQEGILTFLGAGVTCVDNAGNTATECTISGGSSNALLDGTNHTDTLAGTVARGDVIIGNSTPKWARLAKGSAGNQLFTDGTDVSWSSPNLLSTSHGDTLAGSVARGSVIVGNSTPKWAAVTVGANGTFLGSNGTDVTFTNPFLDMTNSVLFDEEFCGGFRGGNNLNGSGALVAGNSISGGAGHPCTRSDTVGAATGTAAYEGFNVNTNTVTNIENNGVTTIMLSARVSSIGDGTDVIKYYLGGCSTGNTGDCNTGMYIRYDRSVSTTNWYLCAASNGSRTCTDTTIAVIVGGSNWTDAVITGNAANNQLSCTINGVACATGPTTNLPAATFGWAPMLKADKTAGVTTTFQIDFDLLRVVQTGMTR